MAAGSLFYFKPAQSDVVTIWTFEAPRTPKQENIAEKGTLDVPDRSRFDREWLALLCGPEAEEVDPTDLSLQVTYKAPG